MLDYAEPVTRLIDEFKRLPGIGHKSAQRLAFHLLRIPLEEAERLTDAIETHAAGRTTRSSPRVGCSRRSVRIALEE